MLELLVVVRPTPRPDPPLLARERVAAQRAAAREALAEAARLVGCTVARFPQESPGGRPLPVDGWHWSLSHDAWYVSAALHRGPVGVDLERIAERRAALHEKVADALERELLAPWDELTFTRLWTAKEAVLKAAGVGLAELSRCRLRAVEQDDLVLEHRGALQRVHQTRRGEHVFAAHAREPRAEVRWDLPP